jgi:hypothetical protein
MALPANAIVSLAEAKEFLNVKSAEQDALLETVILGATAAWENELNRPVKEATYTNLRLIGPQGPKLYLRGTPVKLADPLTVKLAGTVQTVWKSETDGDPADFDVLLMDDVPESPLGVRTHLYRVGGWNGTRSGHPYVVLLTYTGGFNPVPQDLKDAVLYLVQKLFRDRQKQLADVQTVNLPTGAITLFDIALPRWALRVLDKYRWIPVG